MLDAIEGTKKAVAGLDFDAYAESWLVQRAVERALEIVSEASRHLPAAIQSAHADIPWAQIAAIGNVLRHEYQRVEPRLIWNVVEKHLPALECAVRAALSQDPE